MRKYKKREKGVSASAIWSEVERRGEGKGKGREEKGKKRWGKQNWLGLSCFGCCFFGEMRCGESNSVPVKECSATTTKTCRCRRSPKAKEVIPLLGPQSQGVLFSLLSAGVGCTTL